jgi:polysaccharide pyruvyl transferase WcaK-like protein
MVTLTDYSKSRESDTLLLSQLINSYDNVFYWVQGSGDLAYIQSLRFKDKITIVSPKLKKYDAVLDSHRCDYIGTRLHAGIRAIQHGKRALILAVDNRATEIAKDIHLNVRPRDDIQGIASFISGSLKTQLNIPFHEIDRWKAQFL